MKVSAGFLCNPLTGGYTGGRRNTGGGETLRLIIIMERGTYIFHHTIFFKIEINKYLHL